MIYYFTAQSIVCAKIDSHCLEYLGYIALPKLKKNMPYEIEPPLVHTLIVNHI